MADQSPTLRPVALKPIISRPDFASIGGVIISIGGILGGLLLEGGKIRDVAQITAALIVLGGTLGAVMVTTPLPVLLRAMQKLSIVFVEKSQRPQQVIDEIISFATKARKHGIVSLEQDADRVPDEFLRKALNLAVDGTDLARDPQDDGTRDDGGGTRGRRRGQGVRSGRRVCSHGRHYRRRPGTDSGNEASGEYRRSGPGDCRGVRGDGLWRGSANLFFLPAANKLRARTHHAMQIKELMLEGVLAIVEGLNPKLIRTKLEAYTRDAPPTSAQAARLVKTEAAPIAAPQREAS